MTETRKKRESGKGPRDHFKSIRIVTDRYEPLVIGRTERGENRNHWDTSDPGVTWDCTAYAERHLPGLARGRSRGGGRGSDDAGHLTARGHAGVRGKNALRRRCAPLPKFYRRGAHPVGLSPERLRTEYRKIFGTAI